MTRRLLRRRRRKLDLRVVAALTALLAAAALATAACTRDTDTPPVIEGRGTPRPTMGATVRATPPAPSATACAPPYPAPPITADTVACADPAAMQFGLVTRIIDGDTFDAEVAGAVERVRIYGIDTAERGEPCFDEASDRLDALTAGGVRLLADARDRDRFDRLLRYVYRPDGASIDALMVAEGLAHAWREDGALRFALIQLEDRARLSRSGCLWR